MVHALPTAPTCATAWLAAAKYLIAAGDEAYNVIVDIDDPVTHTKEDTAIILAVDRFLRDHHANPISTVTNTIFPNDLARRYRGAELRTEYLAGYDKLRKSWGRYFERMVRWPADGSDQLHNMIGQLRKQSKSSQTFHHVYELALFNPPTDAHLLRNRQCLSFLSFKLHPLRGLTLTAVYRNHTFITRALGNYIGLGYLMQYIAKEAELRVGPLTCISTHAEIDTSAGKDSCEEQDPADVALPWSLRDARGLIHTIAEQSSQAATQRGAGAVAAALEE